MKRLIGAIAGLSLLALAACGGGSSSDDSQDTASSDRTTRAAPAPTSASTTSSTAGLPPARPTAANEDVQAACGLMLASTNGELFATHLADLLTRFATAAPSDQPSKTEISGAISTVDAAMRTAPPVVYDDLYKLRDPLAQIYAAQLQGAGTPVSIDTSDFKIAGLSLLLDCTDAGYKPA